MSRDPAGRLSVLIIEDSPGEAMLARHMLAAWNVVVLNRLEAGLAHLAQTRVDVVLLDLNLPDSKGMDTVIRVRTEAPDVAVVVLTSTDDDAAALEILRLGAQDYLLKKGWGSGQLNRTLRHAVERWRAARRVNVQAARFQTAFMLAPVELAIVDPQLRFTDVNHALCRTLGYTAEEFTSLGVGDVTHPDDRSKLAQAIGEVLAHPLVSHQSELRWSTKAGEILTVRVSLDAVRDDLPGHTSLVLAAQIATSPGAAPGARHPPVDV